MHCSPENHGVTPEFQNGGSIDDNSKILFLISQQKICCDPSLEPSQHDISNDWSQNMFLW